MHAQRLCFAHMIYDIDVPVAFPVAFPVIPNLPLADVMQPLLTITLCNVHEAFCVIGESVPFSSF